ncbi:MAG: SOS response-associated peptidase, partial [Phycisphaerae bacterium]
FANEFGVFFREVGPFMPRFNIAPTQKSLVLANNLSTPQELTRPGDSNATSEGMRAMGCIPMRWGLIPSWAKDASIGARLINARAETVADKPSFRAAFRRRRCLVPTSGFYEWQKPSAGHAKTAKIPYFIRAKSKRLLTFAGLWEEWTSSEGELIHSFTILTTSPNAVMKPLHDRMPVIVNTTDRERWLGSNDPEEVQALLKPFPDDALEAFPVSTLVNNARNESPNCIVPA